MSYIEWTKGVKDKAWTYPFTEQRLLGSTHWTYIIKNMDHITLTSRLCLIEIFTFCKDGYSGDIAVSFTIGLHDVSPRTHPLLTLLLLQ